MADLFPLPPSSSPFRLNGKGGNPLGDSAWPDLFLWAAFMVHKSELLLLELAAEFEKSLPVNTFLMVAVRGDERTRWGIERRFFFDLP